MMKKIYYLSNYRSGIQFDQFNIKMVSVFRIVDVMLIVVQVIYYSIAFIRIPYKYHNELLKEYSNIENFSLSWLKWFNVSFVLIGILCITFYIFNPFQEKNDFFLVLFLFAISVFIWIIGIWSFGQKKPLIAKESIKEIVLDNMEFAKLKDEEIANNLMRYFEDKKPFLDPNLTLTDVSRNIGTNRTYLSSLINSNFGVNFNVFVNQYRTRHIEEYMKNHSKATKEELAQVGGFGSVSSLKRALDKLT